jgi:hypothetical protein
MRIRTWSPRDAVLVLSERDYPGWRARIDGEPTSIVRANYILRAVYVPAGTHVVEVWFEPPGLVAGLAYADRAASAIPLFLVLALLATCLRVAIPPLRGTIPRLVARFPRFARGTTKNADALPD